MKIKQILTVSFIAGLTFAGDWKVDPATAKVNFSVDGPFGTVHGSFSGLQAEIRFNEKDLAASSFSASIDAKSVSTGISLRNSDLRNKEQWLNTDKYPRISFHSTKIEKNGESYKALGILTIKDVTKPAEIIFTFDNKENSGLFKGQFTINRSDYHIGKPGGSVGSAISISLNVPVKS